MRRVTITLATCLVSLLASVLLAHARDAGTVEYHVKTQCKGTFFNTAIIELPPVSQIIVSCDADEGEEHTRQFHRTFSGDIALDFYLPDMRCDRLKDRIVRLGDRYVVRCFSNGARQFAKFFLRPVRTETLE